MNSNVVGPNQIIKVGPMQVDKLSGYRNYAGRGEKHDLERYPPYR